MLSDANQRHQRVPWQQREQWVGTTFEEVRNFAADGTTSRIAAKDDEGHFHYKGLSQRPIKALSYPYLCEHNNTTNVVQMNTRNYYEIDNEDTNQNNPQESGAQSSLSIFAQKYRRKYKDTHFILQNKYFSIYAYSFGVKILRDDCALIRPLVSSFIGSFELYFIYIILVERGQKCLWNVL